MTSEQGQQGRAHKFEADSLYHSVQALTPLAQGRQGEKEVEIMRSPDQETERANLPLIAGNPMHWWIYQGH
jgi:hypothetical protein